MGSYCTKPAAADPDVERRRPLGLEARSSGLSDTHDPSRVSQSKPLSADLAHTSQTPWGATSGSIPAVSQGGISNTSKLCSICSNALADILVGANVRHHSTLSSLENSVRSGCHLCILIKHFLPERPLRQLDDNLSLSLEWGLLMVGWKHQLEPFNLLSFRKLTSFRE